MAILAIQGHATRGSEVIGLLEMLGGKHNDNVYGYNDELYYYVATDGLIYGSSIEYEDLACKYLIFTLEELIEKFPYKVGDKIDLNGDEVDITGLYWDGTANEIIYEGMSVKLGREYDCISVKDMKPYTEQKLSIKDTGCCSMKTESPTCKLNVEKQKEDSNKVIFDANAQCCDISNKIIQKEKSMEEKKYRLDVCDDDKLSTEVTGSDYKLLALDNYLIGKVTPVKNGMIVEYVKKKPQYPKTYEECCSILFGKTDFQDFELVLTKFSANSNIENSISPEPPYIDKINAFYKLLICRNAYWKIAGEAMGLGKPWELCDTKDKYIIRRAGDKILKGYHISCVLEFPTEEMRDVFYENFKELIECCKELL